MLEKEQAERGESSSYRARFRHVAAGSVIVKKANESIETHDEEHERGGRLQIVSSKRLKRLDFLERRINFLESLASVY